MSALFKRYAPIMCAISLILTGCSPLSDGVLQSKTGTITEVGVPGMLRFLRSFGVEPNPDNARNDSNLLRAGVLNTPGPAQGNPLPEGTVQALEDAYGKDAAILVDHLGAKGEALAEGVENVDLSSVNAASLAMMTLAHGNAPVTRFDNRKLPIATPEAYRIGSSYFVNDLASQEDDETSSFYDCTRYAFLFAEAADGEIPMGLDAAWLALRDNDALNERIEPYGEVLKQNPVAAWLLGALWTRNLPYDTSKQPQFFATVEDFVTKVQLKVGDIVVYEPKLFRPLGKLEKDWEATTAFLVDVIAAEMAVNPFKETGKIIANPHESIPELAERVYLHGSNERLRTVRLGINADALSMVQQKALDQRIMDAVEVLLETSGMDFDTLESIHAERVAVLDDLYARHAQDFGTIEAVDENDRLVQARILRGIPTFHAFFVTKVDAEGAMGFLVDGANPTIPASYEPVEFQMYPQSHVNVLRKLR